MIATWNALKVMLTLHLERASGKKSSRSQLLSLSQQAHKGMMLEADVYEPHVKCRGTILVFHGMSPLGKDDARIVTISQALCQVGFRVVSPDIQSIRHLRIELSQIALIVDIVDAVAGDSELTPKGRLSILAPSFSGAMCLAAAAHSAIRDKVVSVCAIGTFTEVDSVMKFLLTDHDADPYGRYIVLKKILPMVMESRIIDQNDTLQQVLDAAIEDNINESQASQTESGARAVSTAFKLCVAELSEAERLLIRQVFDDAEFRLSLFDSAKQALLDEIDALNVAQYLDALSARVLLVHGAQDDVIPCSQSRMLYDSLREKNKSAELVVTPFISHGDTRFSLRQLPDLVRIVKGFSFFFDDLERANSLPRGLASPFA